MLKIRLQGEKKDIKWFLDSILRKNADMIVTEVSDIYSNKGTNKYYRNYIEIIE